MICSTPRSGSYLLAFGLGGTGVAGYPTERFPPEAGHPDTASLENGVTRIPDNVRYDAVADAAYVRRILELGTTPNGVFGVKVQWFQLPDALTRLKSYLGGEESSPKSVLSRAFPNVSYIWLRRRDVIAQAISWYRAMQTMQFLQEASTGASEASAAREVSFDFRKIQFLLSALRSADTGWARFFASHDITPLTLTYESLASSYEDTLGSVLRHLDIETAGVQIGEPRLRKMSDATSTEWADKFRRELQHRRDH